MRRDAVARLQIVLAVVTDLGEAGVASAEPAVPLGAAVIPAAGVLAEVAADRSLVAQRRRRGQPGRGGDGGVGRDCVGRRELCERRRGSDLEAAGCRANPSEPGRLQVDQQRRLAEPTIDLPGEIRASGEHHRPRAIEQVERLGKRPRPGVRAHASASRTRAAVSGRAAQRRPVAWANAFAIAAAVGMIGGSPSPLAPMFGRLGSGTWGKSITISGVSAIDGTL